MFDYAAEKQRRLDQFSRAIEPMHHRTVNIVKGSCFLRIEEQYKQWGSRPELEATKVADRVMAKGISDSFDENFDHEPKSKDWSDEGWRSNDRSKRFIQFIFQEKHFEMDLPRPTLWPTEAKILLERRLGFFFLGERGMADLLAREIRAFHPLRKAYVHGDHHAAAEDVAYIFFELWKFPIDSRLYLSTWGGRNQWDSGTPLD